MVETEASFACRNEHPEQLQDLSLEKQSADDTDCAQEEKRNGTHGDNGEVCEVLVYARASKQFVEVEEDVEEKEKVQQLYANYDKDRKEIQKDILWRQGKVKEMYESFHCQILVASIIILNFGISMIEFELLPTEGSDVQKVFATFEVIFNVIFGLELLMNHYGNWFKQFWLGPNCLWNIFDFVVVGTAWLAVFLDGVPGVATLRLFRAFRVFRLFKKIESLRVIMLGVVKSLPSVTNAFVLLGLIMGIWSILGVEFFGDDFEPEFGNFGRAMLTMFQLATFDSWSSGVARPICLYYDFPLTWVYFVTYEFASAIIMMNVVVAILLDKFIVVANEVQEESMRDKAALEEEKRQREIYNEKQEAAVRIQRHVRKWRFNMAVKRLIVFKRRSTAVVKIQTFFRYWSKKAKRERKTTVADLTLEMGNATDALHAGGMSETSPDKSVTSKACSPLKAHLDLQLQDMEDRLSAFEHSSQIWQRSVTHLVEDIVTNLGVTVP